MNFLLPLISFFIGNAKSLFKEPGIAFTQQLVLHLRALTFVLVSTIGSLALSCVGTSLFIASLAGQLDKGEEFQITGGMIVYLVMTVISAGVLIYSLNKKTWLKALGFVEKPVAPKQSGALENAVALLVMDYVEERQSKRAKTSEAS
ncbi:hypothetical protein [Bdellovibrio bacteriovorus]|uniref:hypothetical protein n=1 Tax=Bdellovibrio bacteriovorus TaxID=959 RepID=UPI00045BEF21|nr:hypothetical protein [Bdellovibrio bacteriovorus]AHZ86234.1 hypothetical protein EP01_15020 [Bdellovibrio bacteriovorus]BEV67471.1 hypothetical protein Bb109J_c0891 [Bdellovibrio bacteriovorus]